ncbi:MAG TPA: bifunctional tRNA (5-methylaminomethyl-2-thiouridine)(34)-methyltransferase MnmD/FAD-dependent 5-carboxymethylaminomethyl-2-thiouridine(34) oxidoreductase MnmC [Burkholderiaceae bacterium]|jgi:tRNA 5-methylaminomethyl-2-thiouridine biosynthesis bifunctional protein|nr:bifunctional tRNA (5-methylaminomethyl-2-thiouridine)(34)-methyltransferase MnmD/FAD-dependent 5-carboxymethylaminomethyl-2-thiouridine(34) oxidoreductase MnmC [Burkholderiaceae bacterium]
MPGIESEALQFDQDGAPYSRRYADVYASRSGALGQAHHVFLSGNGLPSRWAGREQFVIVETGFGLATNFLATWQAWRSDPRRPRRLHFVSVERHPLSAADLTRCCPPPVAALAAQLARAWPLPLSGLHRLVFEAGAVTLTLGLGDARALIPDLMLGADAFYLDGFAPDRNPQLWDPALLKALARLARPDATLASWTVARAVREALSAAGFEVGLREGFGAKRDMLVARYAPRFRTRRHDPPSPYAGAREAVVIGAGLAGCASALALARRGWRVEVLEQGAHEACGASALPAGVLHPSLAVDDSHAARLSRAGFSFGRHQLDCLRGERPLMVASGVLQLAADALAEERWPALLQQQRWPEALVRWCRASEAGQAVGLAPRRGGLWFADGAVVSAAAWCRAMLAAEPGIRLRSGQPAIRIARQSGSWLIEGRAAPIARAPVVVIASALDAPRLLDSNFSPVRPIRGRITQLAAGELAGLRAAITGQGTLVRGLDGRVAVGATYEPMGPDHEPGISDQTAHEGNLERLSQLLAQPVPVRIEAGFDAVRCVATDRTPLAGAAADERAALEAQSSLQGAHLADLPRHAGLYCSFAFGSRGLTLAPLLGELVACLIEGEPAPIERSLAATVDPARFLLRRLRSGRIRGD